MIEIKTKMPGPEIITNEGISFSNTDPLVFHGNNSVMLSFGHWQVTAQLLTLVVCWIFRKKNPQKQHMIKIDLYRTSFLNTEMSEAVETYSQGSEEYTHCT